MHGIELFAVGVESGHAEAAVYFVDAVADLAALGIKPAQDTIEADDEIGAAEFSFDAFDRIKRGSHHVARAGHCKHEAFIDGAEERQAAVRVHIADRSAVVVAANFDDERIRGETEGAEFVGQEPDCRCVFACGGFRV